MLVCFRSKILNDLLKGVAKNNLLALEFLEPYLGNTALIQAAREHHTTIVQKLLEKGANVNLQNFAGIFLYFLLHFTEAENYFKINCL